MSSSYCNVCEGTCRYSAGYLRENYYNVRDSKGRFTKRKKTKTVKKTTKKSIKKK